MGWSRKRLLGLAAATAGLALALLIALFVAVRHEPASYAAACATDPTAAAEQCDHVLQQAALLASSESMGRPWSLDLSEQQVNAWLAVDLPRNHAYLLSDEISDPRVTIDEEGQIRVGARYHRWGLTSILQLVLEVELIEQNLLAVRFVRARAGAIPLPLAQALDVLSQAAQELDLKVTWRESGGTPLALVRLPGASPGQTALTLDALTLEGDSLRASGSFSRGRDLPLANRPGVSAPR